MRRWARGLGLFLILPAALAVMSLPGTTSVSSAPTLDRLLGYAVVEAADVPADPILLPVSLPALIAAAAPSAIPLGRADAALALPPQVVSVYGFPGICSMGELGCHEPAAAAARARVLAAALDEANGDRGGVPALHLIVAVAQPEPGPDGTYLAWMPEARIREWVEVARAERVMLFLDLQIGWSDPMDGVRRIEWALGEPFVHLALDPEFATRHRGLPPGEAIGTLVANDVNAVQARLAQIVTARAIPAKMLVLHQFTPTMLTEKARYLGYPEVAITIDMDGYGSPAAKLSGYEAYAREGAELAALKLFFRWDEPLLSPAELQALPHPPDYVIYQ